MIFTYFNNFDCPHCNLVEVLKFFTPWHTHSKVVKNSPKGKKGKKGCVRRRPHLSCFPSFFRQNISIYTLESQLVDWAMESEANEKAKISWAARRSVVRKAGKTEWKACTRVNRKLWEELKLKLSNLCFFFE